MFDRCAVVRTNPAWRCSSGTPMQDIRPCIGRALGGLINGGFTADYESADKRRIELRWIRWIPSFILFPSSASQRAKLVHRLELARPGQTKWSRVHVASFRVYVSRWLHKPASVHHTIGTVSNSLTFRCPGIVPSWPSSNKQVLVTHRNN